MLGLFTSKAPEHEVELWKAGPTTEQSLGQEAFVPVSLTMPAFTETEFSSVQHSMTVAL